jgi:hypothetical protein
VLFHALAKFKDRQKSRHESADTICEARRNFLDSFAYLCDVEKGGKTVTATALQSLVESDFLWLAANEGIRDDILDYAMAILQISKSVSLENELAVKARTFSLAVEKCRPRNRFYREQVQKYATQCRMELGKSQKDDLGRNNAHGKTYIGLLSK